jgi:hypothetical protein
MIQIPRFPFFLIFSHRGCVVWASALSFKIKKKFDGGKKQNAKKSRNPTRKELFSVETSFFVVVASRFIGILSNTL